jgi:sec-independent protein translocase protein TatA
MIGMPGPMELILILGVALLVIGPKKLPEMGKSLGEGMRSFKDSMSDDKAGSEEPKGL